MSWASTSVTRCALRLRGLFAHTRMERELDDEVRFHLDMQIEDNLSAGMNPAEARYAALRSFGAIEPMKENYRERSAFAFVETVAQDLRYAIRTLRRNPSFALTSVATLALAIGANTAMFSVLNAVLFRPLPYRSPEQLAMLWTETPDQRVRESRSAYLSVEQWRGQSQSFADIAFFDGVSATLMSADKAEQISVVRVSPNFFSLLGVQPMHGRSFSMEEAGTQQRLAVISHRFWQSRFGGSRDAIGSTIELDQRRSRIIGILPESFELGGNGSDVWEPHTLYPDWETLRQRRGSGLWSVIGRLRPDVTFEQAQAEMNTIARGLDEQLPPTERNRGISVVPLSLQLTGAKARLALWMLTGAVLFVLLIAAFNVASLSLARAASREREIAVRAALGASRGRIIRQLLAESITLAVIAGLLGLFVALAGIQVILAMKPGDLIRLNEVSLDPHVLGSALALCLLTGILVGLAPAVTMARRSLQPASQEGGRSIAGGIATRRIRRALVVSEFALAIVLLVGAGLLIRSLWSIQNVDPGFRREGVLSVSLAPPASVAPAQRTHFYNQVLEQTESLPGVESAAMTSELFIGGNPERAITTEDGALPAGERIRLRSDELSEEFFKTLGTPLLKGRFFSASDGRPDSPKVAIINDAMARRLWGERDPVGKRFTFGTDGAAVWFTVVGVVGGHATSGTRDSADPADV